MLSRYDRTVGGLEISLRLRDHLVNEFRKQKKTEVDITKNPRAMAKMLKEAERVKMVSIFFFEMMCKLDSETRFVAFEFEIITSSVRPSFFQCVME